LVFATLLAAPCVSCTTDDAHPPPPPGNACAGVTCFSKSSSAAVAVESALDDGGACGDAAQPLRFSLPQGDDAFSSILACGGNAVRCGAADYRVSSADPSVSIRCDVPGIAPFRLNATVARVGGPSFDVEGAVSDGGGRVTVSAGAGPDGGAVGPLSCSLTRVPFQFPGSIWAEFECGTDTGTSPCRVRGTFVFENCAKEADASP
jgi:hypothetical protein